MKIIRKIESIKKVVIASFCLFIVSFLFQGCEKEEFDFEFKEEVTEEKVINLANKYGIEIGIGNSMKDAYEVSSLEELEQIFASIDNHRKQSISKKLIRIRNGNFTVLEPKQKMKLSPRLKNGTVESAIWGESEWFFNLTWLSADIGYQSDNQNVTITSDFSGISLFNYVQDQSTYEISGDTIYYQFSGTATMSLTIGGFGIQSNSGVNASGWVNTSTGEGQMSIDTNNGYWYD